MFFNIYAFGYIAGNLIASFVIKLFSQEVFFIVMSIFAFIGWATMMLLIEPTKQENSETENDDEYSPLTALENSNSIDNKSDNLQPTQGSLRSTIRLFFTVKMMKINGLIVISAIIVSYYGGFLVKMISNVVDGDDDEKLTKSLYCMIVFSWGEIVSGYAIGKLIDRTSRRFGVFLIFIVITITTSLTAYTHFREKYDAFWYFSAFFWGLSDSICWTVISSICGGEFSSNESNEGSVEPFSILQFTQSFVVCILIIIESFIKDPNQTTIQRWYLIGAGVYSIIASLWALTFPFKAKPKKT